MVQIICLHNIVKQACGKKINLNKTITLIAERKGNKCTGVLSSVPKEYFDAFNNIKR